VTRILRSAYVDAHKIEMRVSMERYGNASRYVSLKKLEFGVYDAVSNFNMGRKASVLTFKQVNMIPGKYMLHGCSNLNNKRIIKSLYRDAPRNKLRRKILRGKKMKKI